MKCRSDVSVSFAFMTFLGLSITVASFRDR